MPRWTTEQQNAIDIEGENVIVSAGAGSGKTAVLTARVLRKLKQGTNIDELLILTFTKAAAAEMKERIRSSIRKEPDLKEQLDKIDSAYITTFDSYAFSIVKKYHYLLNCSKNIAIGDATVLTLKKKEFIAELFEELYEKEDSSFLEMISYFCVKDDKELQSSVLEMSDKLDLNYDKLSYLKTYVETYYQENHILALIQSYEELLGRKVHMIQEAFSQLELCVDSSFIDKMLEVLQPVLSAKRYDEVLLAIDIKLPMLPRGCEEDAKTYKELISSTLKDLKSMCIYASGEELKATLLSTKNTVQVLIQILLTLDERFAQYKEDHEIYQFIDISKMAIRVLEENPSVCQELKNHFKEIMVDEYQDTNDLQERFIKRIENHNVYMVGDIKQSIYRFRNANPSIFKDKYQKYREHDGGAKIDLNKNFRSRGEVLANINMVFDFVMDEFLGGAAYQESHRMIFGNQTYLEEGKTSQGNDFEILDYTLDKTKGFKKEEIEIFLVAHDIKSKVENHYQIFDKDQLLLRDATYSDFVILMDRSTQFDLYKQIFTYEQIPLSIEKDESITSEVDLVLFKNILTLIIKTRKKEFDTKFQFCFMSIGRSYLYRLLDQDMFKYLTKKEYQLAPFMSLVSAFATKLETYTPRSLLDDIVSQFPFYEQMITKGDVEGSLNRLEYLQNLARTLEDQGYTVYDLENYFDGVVSEGLDLKYNTQQESGNSVKIMTIHKSKGLEFPICYYTGLYAKFNISDLKSKFTFDPTFGILVPYFQNGVGQTIVKSLMKEKYLEDEIGEKIRLFYVALTRAKEKMIFVTSLDEEAQDTIADTMVRTDIRLGYQSFQGILKSVQSVLKPYITKVDLNSISMSRDYNVLHHTSIDEILTRGEDSFVNTEVVWEQVEKTSSHVSKTIEELLTPTQQKAIELGLLFHQSLSALDLKHPCLEALSPFIKDKVEDFLHQDLLESISEARVYQEYEFVEEIENREVHGIIDLLLLYPDHAIIIDYKLKKIADPAYQKQLQGYATYVKEKTNLPVTCYLYSIMDATFVEVSV